MNLKTTISIYGGGPGSGCNPQAGKCGRHSTGESKVYATPKDIRKFNDWGEIKYQWVGNKGQGEGSLVKGIPMSKEDVVKKYPELYHVTTNLPAVLQSGKLLARSTDTEGGLGSSGQASAVSFTTSKKDAQDIKNDLLHMGELARNPNFSTIEKIAKEDEQSEGLAPGTLDKAVAEAKRGFDLNMEVSKQFSHDPQQALLSNLKDAYNSYLWSRESAGGRQNTIIVGGLGNFKQITPDKIGILTVPSKNIPDEALARDRVSDDFLHELQVDADVPIKDYKLLSAASYIKAALRAQALFRGIPITGFSHEGEEEVRAMISRIPPELLFNVKQIVANSSLGVKHGKFITETSTVQLNPRTFKLRQKFGKGPGWFSHMQLVVVHEICHSIFDGLSEQQKQQWEELSGWKVGKGEGQSEPYVEKRPGWPPYTSEWTHKKGVTFPRHYSEKNPDEDFADCMAFFLLGKPHQMSPNKKEFLQSLVNQRVKRYPQAAIFGPDSAFGERRLAYKSKFV